MPSRALGRHALVAVPCILTVDFYTIPEFDLLLQVGIAGRVRTLRFWL